MLAVGTSESWQTVQTQFSQLLKEQSVQALHFLPFHLFAIPSVSSGPALLHSKTFWTLTVIFRCPNSKIFCGCPYDLFFGGKILCFSQCCYLCLRYGKKVSQSSISFINR